MNISAVRFTAYYIIPKLNPALKCCATLIRPLTDLRSVDIRVPAEELEQHLDEVPKDRAVITYCT